MRKQEIVNSLHCVKIFPLFRNVALKIRCYLVTDDPLLRGGGSVASTGSATERAGSAGEKCFPSCFIGFFQYNP